MEDDERKNVVASGIGTLLTMGGGNISIDMAMPGCKISEKRSIKHILQILYYYYPPSTLNVPLQHILQIQLWL